MSGHETPQQVLWAAGTKLLDVSAPVDGDHVVAEVLAEVGGHVGADGAMLAEYSRASGRITTLIGDERRLLADLPPIHSVPADLLRTMTEGPTMLAVGELIGDTEAARRALGDAVLLAAPVEETEAGIYGVIFVALRDPAWSDDDLELMRGTALLVRQFHRRRAVERSIVARRDLDRLTLEAATTLQGVTAARFDAAISKVLGLLLDALDLRAALVIDVVAPDAIELPYGASRWGSWADRGRLSVPADAFARTGLDSLDDLLTGPRVFSPEALEADLLDRLLPPASQPRQARSALVVPAEAGTTRAALAVVRPPEVSWSEDEIEAVSTVGAMIANTRALCLAELDAQARFAAQHTLTEIGRRFVNAPADEAAAVADRAFRDLVEALGADFGVVARLRPDGPDVIRIWEGAAERSPGVPPPELVDELAWLSDEAPQSRPLAGHAVLRAHWSIDAEGPWTVVASPVNRIRVTYAVAVPHTSSVPTSVVMDALASFGDLSSQLQLRAAAELRTARRAAADSTLSTVADEFLGGSSNDQVEVEMRALARIGSHLGIDGLVIHDLGDQPHVARVWRSGAARGNGVSEGTAVGAALRHAIIECESDTTTLRLWDVLPAAESRRVRERWGDHVDPLIVPCVVGGELIASIAAIGSGGWTDSRRAVLRSLATMVGQFRLRVAAARRDDVRLRTEHLLADFATELAEATAETSASIIREAFGAMCDVVGLDQVAIWRIDPEKRQYLLAHGGAPSGEFDEARLPRSKPFGSDGVLDAARATDDWIVRGEREATDEHPSLVAFKRRDRGDDESIFVATSTSREQWQPVTLELFRSVSSVLRDVEARLAADRYADAAFNNAPIGVVLRDDRLRLITCNDAFLRFVGAEDVADVIGTMPNEFYADGIEEIDWIDDGGALHAEAAFARRDGTRVWGQMRGSVVEGDAGEHFWLVHVEDVTQRRRAEALLRFQATHDELTGLANRSRLAQDIAELAQAGTSAAVLLLDLDRFKNINDSMGHDHGDEMLVAIADRLRLAIRPGDLVARLGGDEFAVVLPGPVTVTDAEMVADRLLRLISEPMWIGSQTVYPTASIGIALSDSPEISDLLRRADTAMYRAKAQGRAQHAAFDEALQQEVTDRMATEAGLRGALRAGQFLVYYQPEVSTIDGTMLGAEALVRWDHPEKGIVAAGAFIDVAEETGLVVDIGTLVLNEAVAEAATWPGGDDGPVVRVNLAAAQLQRDETVALVREVLARTGLAPHRLCLEITESAVMTDIKRSEEILIRLKELGVLLAVDDFGTGFSSLAYLKRFPVDALKIDRAFVMGLGADEDDLAFVRSIISLADALGLEVVAEGVETQTQARIIAGLGCHRAQGYLYARPGPAAALHPFMVS